MNFFNMEISLTLDQVINKFQSVYNFVTFMKSSFPEVHVNYQVIAKIYYLNGSQSDLLEIQKYIDN